MDRPQQPAEFVLDSKDDLSHDELTRRGDLRRPTIHRLATQPIRALPDPDTLIKLAVAPDVSVYRVTVAALQAAGVPVTDRIAAGDVLDGLDASRPSSAPRSNSLSTS